MESFGLCQSALLECSNHVCVLARSGSHLAVLRYNKGAMDRVSPNVGQDIKDAASGSGSKTQTQPVRTPNPLSSRKSVSI